MNRAPLIALLVLCLPACATHSGTRDSPESDLDVLETNVRRDLQPTTLPNGREYCAELAITERQQDTCLEWHEGALYASNEDKARAASTLHKGIARLKAARIQCSWWDVACKRRRAALQSPSTPP